MKIRSLQQRLTLFLILPVAVTLIIMAAAGFIYARNSMLRQWKETAILRLQRGAHFIDMRLSRPKQWLNLFLATGASDHPDITQEWLVDRLKGLEGVSRVTVTQADDREAQTLFVRREPRQGRSHRGPPHGGERGRMHFRRGTPIEITPPRYDSYTEHETVSLVSELSDEGGRLVGTLRVDISFQYLLKDLEMSPWRGTESLFLVDGDGSVLTCNVTGGRKRLGEHGDPLELRTLQALQERQFGTLFGEGRPPDMVSGFHHLNEAPWTLVVMAPGQQILAPIIRFRSYYAIGGTVFIVLVLFLIRLLTRPTVTAIKEVAVAADQIARGERNPLVPVRSEDEVGQLIRSFNTMALHLDERIRLKQALDLAVEVQQSLLPKGPPHTQGLDIAGKALYCDETGGDYYDFLDFVELGEGKLAVAVGDVAGHGLGAALLMTTVRSLLRSRVTQPGSLARIIADVNRLLCLDTSESASFMTLFFMIIDEPQGTIRWVRAGHDPAILYDPETDCFEELRGSGMALGIEEEAQFEQNEYTGWSSRHVMVIGTDGIWEAENESGEQFGKERLKTVMRAHHLQSAEAILKAITDSLETFQGEAPQQDDITLVVLKNKVRV